jgi:hypothetical protein
MPRAIAGIAKSGCLRGVWRVVRLRETVIDPLAGIRDR